MITADLYTSFFEEALGDGVDITGSGTIKVALFDDSFSFDPTHAAGADLTGEITNQDDYSQAEVPNPAVTLNADNLPYQVNYDCDDVSFGAEVTISAYHAVFIDTGNDKPLFHIDYDGVQEAENGTFKLEIDPNGLFNLTTEAA